MNDYTVGADWDDARLIWIDYYPKLKFYQARYDVGSDIRASGDTAKRAVRRLIAARQRSEA